MRNKSIWLLGILLTQASMAVAAPLQGGVEQSQSATPIQGGTDAYPAPVMIQQTPRMAPTQIRRPPLQGNTQMSAPPRQLQGNTNQSAPMQAQAVALPRGFLGRWNVMGQRTKVEAQPEFQQGAEQAFQMNTNNMWSINGNPGNYAMSNGEMSTAIWVDKVEGGTAFIRYQHPVGKTMAQEAIVMSLTPNGVQFNGLERISIVKEGLTQPRAKVTYQLSGRRQ